MKITIPKPPSINHLYGTNRYTGAKYITTKGKDWFNEVGEQLITLPTRPDLIDVECDMYITLYTSRFQDLDNILKALLDVVKQNNLITDDSLIKFLQINKVKVKHRNEEKVEFEIKISE